MDPPCRFCQPLVRQWFRRVYRYALCTVCKSHRINSTRLSASLWVLSDFVRFDAGYSYIPDYKFLFPFYAPIDKSFKSPVIITSIRLKYQGFEISKSSRSIKDPNPIIEKSQSCTNTNISTLKLSKLQILWVYISKDTKFRTIIVTATNNFKVSKSYYLQELFAHVKCFENIETIFVVKNSDFLYRSFRIGRSLSTVCYVRSKFLKLFY